MTRRAQHKTQDNLKKHIQEIHNPGTQDKHLDKTTETWERANKAPELALQCPFCRSRFDSWKDRAEHVGNSLKARSMPGYEFIGCC